jgi:hypothetical protein
MGTTASERHDDINNVYKSDAEAKNKSTMIEKHYEEPAADVDNTEADDGTDTTTVPHTKPTNHSSNRLLNTNYACSDLDITSPTSTENIDHVYANLPQVIINTLLTENTRLKEMLVAQLDETEEQAAMDKKQFLNELMLLKDKIIYLEDKALKLHEGPPEPTDEKLHSPSSPQETQRHQKIFFPRPHQDPNKIMVECCIPEQVVDEPSW